MEKEEDEEENWPPWVTAQPPEKATNDIEVVEDDEIRHTTSFISKPKPRQPSFNRSSPSLSGSGLFVILASVLVMLRLQMLL